MTTKPSTYLPFPFAHKAEIIIENESGITTIEAELASSEIEIFQSACYRTTDLEKPLVLLFSDPTIEHFTLQNYKIPVEQLFVEYETNKIVGVYWLKPKKDAGNEVQAFTGLRCVILAKSGFSEINNISFDHTTIMIKTIDHEK